MRIKADRLVEAFIDKRGAGWNEKHGRAVEVCKFSLSKALRQKDPGQSTERPGRCFLSFPAAPLSMRPGVFFVVSLLLSLVSAVALARFLPLLFSFQDFFFFPRSLLALFLVAVKLPGRVPVYHEGVTGFLVESSIITEVE